MDLGGFKAAQRSLWATGDYPPIGRMLAPAARILVDRVGVSPGDRVLDVATGSGSAAVAAAQAGGDVIGLDITDAWFDAARRSSRTAGVSLDLVVGDAEHLPLATASCDVVLSSFGAIFAPRHEVVAAELARVCRPGGRIGMTAWPPDGTSNAVMSTLTSHAPAPPPFATPSIRWGDPEHVRQVWSAHDVDVEITRPSLTIAFASAAAFESFVFDTSGALANVRLELERQGRWAEVCARFRRAVERTNEADDGSFQATWDFLLLVATTRTQRPTGPA